MKSLISVIVPVYKVEEFLDECIQSIVNQTYTNLEIILVDDGSPDKSPQVCDEWGHKDDRIQVIHKVNGGLSSARNAGLQVATGDYISFVDSDDFFDDRMYEKLYEGITRSSNIGVSAIKFYKFIDGQVSIYNSAWDTQKDVLVKANDFGILTLKKQVCFAATNKLYRRDLLENVRFREGLLNEDTLFSYDLSKEMVRLNVDMWDLNYYAYYYRIRQDSICHSDVPIEIPYMENLQIMISESEKEEEKNEILRVYYSAVFMFCSKVLSENPILKSLQNDYFKKYWSILKSTRYFDVVEGCGSVKKLISYCLIKYIPQLFILSRRLFR